VVSAHLGVAKGKIVGRDISIDIGGTFTDLFGIDNSSGETFSAKSLTTYDDLASGVFSFLKKSNN
jgi:N-methylhydantoinase A